MTEPFESQVIGCTSCARLREHTAAVAEKKKPAFSEYTYWGKPVPTFFPRAGRAGVKLLVVGLAPSAHGANRTGRMFTGDRSGDWLYRSMHKFGLCSQASSMDRLDGLELIDCAVTCTVRCAPPQNKPSREEFQMCRVHGHALLAELPDLKVIVALGGIAFREVQKWLGSQKLVPFAHGKSIQLGSLKVITSYHPSQQNTFTGVLTEEKLDSVFQRARDVVGAS